MQTNLLNPTSPQWLEVATTQAAELRFRFVKISMHDLRMTKNGQHVLFPPAQFSW